MPAIAVQHTATSGAAWDGSAAKSNLKNDGTEAYYRRAFAWQSADGDPTTKAAYKFIHHEVSGDGEIGAANLTACSAAIAVLNGGRGGANIPEADRKGVHAHVGAHLKDAGKDVPELKSRSVLPGHLRVEIKALAEDGTFEGLLSVYGVVDSGKDVVEPGAFTKTIEERGSVIPLLWQHDTKEPIGQLDLIDGPDALRVKGRLLLDLPMAQKAYLLLKAGIIKGLSIGYEAIKKEMDGGIRHLKEVRLWEGSIVTFPMLESAVVTAIKARQQDAPSDFNEEFTELQLSMALWQMLQALREALTEGIMWSDLSDDDTVTLTTTIVDQFREACLNWLPQYLAMRADEDGGMEMMGRKPGERKVGRTISAETARAIKACHQKMQDGMACHEEASSLLLSLLDSEAGVDATSGKGAESDPREPEPVLENHSAATKSLITDIRSLIQSAA